MPSHECSKDNEIEKIHEQINSINMQMVKVETRIENLLKNSEKQSELLEGLIRFETTILAKDKILEKYEKRVTDIESERQKETKDNRKLVLTMAVTILIAFFTIVTSIWATKSTIKVMKEQNTKTSEVIK